MSTVETHPARRATARDGARDLRRRAIAAGEPGLNLRTSEALEALPLPYVPDPLPLDATPDERHEAELEPYEYADGMLVRHGVRAVPRLADAGPGGVVNLRPTRRYAVQGAVGLGVAAVALVSLTSQIAAAGWAPFAAAGAALVWWKLPLLDRFLPAIIPRGRTLGALVVLVFIAISTIVVVEPLRDRASERGMRYNATVNAQRATELAAADQLGDAVAFAQLAAAEDPEAPGVAATVAAVKGAAEARLAEAENLQAAGDWDEAQEALATLDQTYDAPAIAARYRTEAAAALIAEAETALEAGDAGAAFTAYNAALRWDPKAANDYLLFRIADAYGIG